MVCMDRIGHCPLLFWQWPKAPIRTSHHPSPYRRWYQATADMAMGGGLREYRFWPPPEWQWAVASVSNC